VSTIQLQLAPETILDSLKLVHQGDSFWGDLWSWSSHQIHLCLMFTGDVLWHNNCYG
jgi:hypothetical protein